MQQHQQQILIEGPFLFFYFLKIKILDNSNNKRAAVLGSLFGILMRNSPVILRNLEVTHLVRILLTSINLLQLKYA